jgi:RimJ/RimL family protein N-acetyltransferase
MTLEYVFIERGLNKLWCEVLSENDAVLKLHAAFGFSREAVFRQHIRKAGRFVDVVGLGLLRQEWLGLRQGSCERLVRRGHAAKLMPID